MGALSNGFDDPLFFASFKLAGKAPNIHQNGALSMTSLNLLTPTSFSPARDANQFSFDLPDAEKSFCMYSDQFCR